MCAARWNQIVNEAAIIQEAEEGGNEGIFIQDKEEKEVDYFSTQGKTEV